MIEKEKRVFSKQGGVGLVEVLVALLVFSVGMLGVASLQVLSRKSAFEAQQRQEAVLLASELVARMKASGLPFRDVATNNDIVTLYGTLSFSASAQLAAPTPCSLVSSDCTAAEIALWDLYEWHQSIAASSVTHGSGSQALINAKGCIAYDTAGTNQVIKVTIAWESMTKMGAGDSGDCEVGSSGNKKQRHVEIKTYI